jgi:tetratricopeptide (TPR) repeat protein
MGRDEAMKSFSNTHDLIMREDGTVWIPVETTLLSEGFLAAWAAGAKQWRTHFPNNEAGFFETSTAWKTYQPVAFSVSDIELGMPPRDVVISSVRQELETFINREIYPREQRLLTRIESVQNSGKTMNKLGVLYARYGLYGKAEKWFVEAIDRFKYFPALINMANIHFIAGDYGRARDRYEQALDQRPENAAALLGLARVEHEMENFGSARKAYEQLAAVSSEIAEKYSYLALGQGGVETGRAADSGSGPRVLWEEEE